MASVAFYVRPLLNDSEAAQLDRLTTWAEANGHDVIREFIEPERRRGPDRRQEQRRMLADAPRGQWDRLACVSLLAMARSCVNAAEVFESLAALGISITVLSEVIDTATDEGRTAAGLSLAGRLEQACHAERATVGVHKRIAAGFKHGRPRIPASTEARIVSLIRAGTSTTRIMRIVGCGQSTVARIRQELKPAP